MSNANVAILPEKSMPLSSEEQEVLASLINPDAPTTQADTLPMEKTLQQILLGGIMKNVEFMDAAQQRGMKPEYFTSKSHQAAAEVLFDYHRQFGCLPTNRLWFAEYRQKIEEQAQKIVKRTMVDGKSVRDPAATKLAQEQHIAHSLGEVTQIWDYELPEPAEEPFFLKQLEDFCNTMALKIAMGEIISDIKKNPDQVEWAKIAEKSVSWYQPATNVRKLKKGTAVFDIQPLEWLVVPFFHKRKNNFIYGPSESFKTFCTLDLALSIAHGENFLQMYPTEQGKVVWVAAEGASSLPGRIKAWLEDRQIEFNAENWLFYDEPFNLSNKAETMKLIRDLKDEKPVAIFFDTWFDCTSGIEEAASKDNSVVKDHCLQLIRELDCALMFIAHTGKDATKGIRGHSSVPAGADSIMEVKREGNCLELVCKKHRDAKHWDSFFCKFVEVGETGVIRYDHVALEPQINLMPLLKFIIDNPGFTKTQMTDKGGFKKTARDAHLAELLSQNQITRKGNQYFATETGLTNSKLELI